MVRHLLIAAVSIAAFFATSAPAGACASATGIRPLFHATLPTLPDRSVAMNVEIVAVSQAAIEGRIIAMVRGRYSGARFRIALQGVNSCDGRVRPGDRGLLVGRIVSASEEALVIDPIRGPSEYENSRRR